MPRTYSSYGKPDNSKRRPMTISTETTQCQLYSRPKPRAYMCKVPYKEVCCCPRCVVACLRSCLRICASALAEILENSTLQSYIRANWKKAST